ncbi:DUF5681 domain-containing protein [Methylobacterium longum]|uniref:DUF5681 domain-containing protein n=1 Tax=Methylobacterium longum TaxID=767694 RepID=A0ABT8AIC6_9HYPH|nr:DUF5681 domain-containing protein [Methylobacterium longum]MDN3569263.1 hypothetical protein [Methylobacterium longum]GJE14265.1 hypothetical protein FOHLNKBM_5338 [Methylobacterium longum]
MTKPTNLKPFAPGQSGNPGGRPRLPDDVKQLARGYTREALETLAGVMRNDEAPAAARVTAASHILDRAWGKPAQHLTVDPVGDLTDAELGSELAAAVEQLRRLGRAGASEAADDGGEAPPTAH